MYPDHTDLEIEAAGLDFGCHLIVGPSYPQMAASTIAQAKLSPVNLESLTPLSHSIMYSTFHTHTTLDMLILTDSCVHGHGLALDHRPAFEEQEFGYRKVRTVDRPRHPYHAYTTTDPIFKPRQMRTRSNMR
ncbi:hypothetical protein N7G274_006344 [Stereocaulon virgatum]|uniref:Uncharacterized protein n=1 Tax=Stereocaulon virgatum TaxID=373712 RepID=A0ABR4A685_9LECA